MPDGCVFLMDKPEDIMTQVQARRHRLRDRRASYDKENKAGISNLLTIYCAATGKTLARGRGGVCGPGLRRVQARRGRGRGGDCCVPSGRRAERIMDGQGVSGERLSGWRGACPPSGAEDPQQGAAQGGLCGGKISTKCLECFLQKVFKSAIIKIRTPPGDPGDHFKTKKGTSSL